MKRLVKPMIVMGMMACGLWMAGLCFAQGAGATASLASAGIAGVWGGSAGPVCLAEGDDPNDPNTATDPNEPLIAGDE